MLAQVVLFDGFDPLDVVAPYEVLHAGGMITGGALHVELVSAEGRREVRSGSGSLTLQASAALDPDPFDVTVDGDTMTGTSKAGRLPTSKVTGRRAPATQVY